jgi:hypothetical protein
MCYEFEALFAKARIAEQLRRNKTITGELKKQSSKPTPTVPVEPEKRAKDQELVPA